MSLARRPLLATLLGTLLALGGALVAQGVQGAISAALAGLVISLTFSVTFWLMERTRRLRPEAVMAVALAAYGGKILLLGVLLVLVADAPWLNATVFALTLMATTVLWLTVVVIEALRNRTPIYGDPR